MKAALLAVLMFVPGAAWAGCTNYVDGSLSTPAPKVTTCFEGACEDTTVDFTCGNIHGAFIGFANGWRVDFVVEGDGEQPDPKASTITTHKGKTVPNDALVCKSGGRVVQCLGSGD